MSPRPHILICPLNWGLGHASRMIPLISLFLEKDCRITVVSSGAPLRLLTNEFSDKIELIYFQGTEISYPKGGSMAGKMAMQMPAIAWGIWKEKKITARLVKNLKPDIIISDNRYGMSSKKVLSVFVTHQLQIKMPQSIQWLEKVINRINHSFIKTFDLCLVPDTHAEPGLSGSLSHKTSLSNLHFTGILSRFSDVLLPHNFAPAGMPDNFVLVILSGPEPQRSILENTLKAQLQKDRVVWFRGLPGNSEPSKTGNHIFYDHAPTKVMAWCIKNSEIVICRSGYSSVMDLAVFGKKAVMIPTPGQTEQEYLARHLQALGYIATLPQNNAHQIGEYIKKAQSMQGLPLPEKESSVNQTVDKLLDMMKDRQKGSAAE